MLRRLACKLVLVSLPWVLLIACHSGSGSSNHEAVSSAQPVQETNNALGFMRPAITKPVVFARFNAGDVGNKFVNASLRSNTGADDLCSLSDFYRSASANVNNTALREVDLCSPQPKLVSKEIERRPAVWPLPRTPTAFFWQQAVHTGQILTVEIQDAQGLPWPSTTVVRDLSGLQTVEVRPSMPLPQDVSFYLIGRIQTIDGKQQEVWMQKATVDDGNLGKPPWLTARR